MAPEATTVEKTGTEVLKSLTPGQQKKWRATGELPAEPTQEEIKAAEEKAAADKAAADKAAAEKKSAESTTTSTTTPAAGAEPKAEPAATATSRGKGAEVRIKELLADNKRLRAELEELQSKPASQPKIPDVAPKPQRAAVDPKTGQLLYATDEAFAEALEKWTTEKVTHDVRREIAKENEAARVTEQNKIIERRLANSLAIAQERYPDFSDVVKIETKDGKTLFHAEGVKAIRQNGIVDAWILDSEIGAELLYFFAKNADEVHRIQALNPFAAARELTKLEEKLSGEPASPKGKELEKPAGKPTIVPPSPAASVGGKGTAPKDEILAATQAGDFRRFKAAADAEQHRERKAS